MSGNFIRSFFCAAGTQGAGEKRKIVPVLLAIEREIRYFDASQVRGPFKRANAESQLSVAEALKSSPLFATKHPR
jgi:hypothetical protein